MALYATNRFPGDGTTTSYEFNFVGKYINRAHVKVYQEDNVTKARTYVSINDSNFLNDTTLRGLPVTPVGSTLVIYRETPKPPLVDFVNGSRFTEHNLDLVARQGLFVATEAMDAGGSEAFDDRYLGQKPADPAKDNNGGTLLVGALYFRTTAPIGMKVWTGAAWDDAYANLSSKFDKTGGAIDGDINFTGTARRITGDFSNATVANRTLVQTSGVNAATDLTIVPNGTATYASVSARSSASADAAVASLVVNESSWAVELWSSRTGASAYLPLRVMVGDVERLRIDPATGDVLATSGALGYGVGAGGTVVQATSKSTAVTLNKPSGQIIMNNEALGAGYTVFFQLNNSLISGADTVQVVTFGGGASYLANCVSVAAGAALMRVVNNTGGWLSDAVILNFAIIKGAAS